MSVHYLNPEDEPRECPRCEVDGKGAGTLLDFDGSHPKPCDVCNGTGQLGNPDGPRVDVRWELSPEGGYVYLPIGWLGPAFGDSVGTWSTEAAALEAARKAHREER